MDALVLLTEFAANRSLQSPPGNLALFFCDKFLPDFPMFGLVTVILKLGHLSASFNQGVQQRQNADIQFPEKTGGGGIPFPDRSKGINELHGIIVITALVMLPNLSGKARADEQEGRQ